MLQVKNLIAFSQASFSTLDGYSLPIFCQIQHLVTNRHKTILMWSGGVSDCCWSTEMIWKLWEWTVIIKDHSVLSRKIITGKSTRLHRLSISGMQRFR